MQQNGAASALWPDAIVVSICPVQKGERVVTIGIFRDGFSSLSHVVTLMLINVNFSTDDYQQTEQIFSFVTKPATFTTFFLHFFRRKQPNFH